MSNDIKDKAARDLERIQSTPEPLKRVLRPVKKLIFDMPRDVAAAWVLEKPEAEDEPYLDILRFGACEFRATENAHTMAAPVGWPIYMEEGLKRHGITLAFQNLFVWHFGDFPDAATIRKRRRKRRGTPDVIVIQTGGFPAMRHVFGFNVWSFLARENLGRRLGPLMHPIWRVMDIGLRLFGRPAPYYPAQPDLEQFVNTVREVYPGVPIEFWLQSDPVLEGSWVRPVADRLIAEATPVLERLDVEIIDAAPIPQTMALRGANGLNFNDRGSRAVGEHYSNHLLARYRHLARSKAERAAEQPALDAGAPADAETVATAPEPTERPGTGAETVAADR